MENYGQDSIFVSVMEEKSYELSNHLGNVHITLSDYRYKEEDGLGVVYFSQVKSASDYYPFGQLLTEGNYSAGDYRFGFNGKEMDNEVKGTGNSESKTAKTIGHEILHNDYWEDDVAGEQHHDKMGVGSDDDSKDMIKLEKQVDNVKNKEE